MNLTNFYLISQGIYGIIGTIFFFTATIILIIIIRKINSLEKRVAKIAQKANCAVSQATDFSETILKIIINKIKKILKERRER